MLPLGAAPETLAELGTPGRLSPRFGAALVVARGPPPRGAGQRLGLRELRREGVGRGREHAQEVEAGGWAMAEPRGVSYLLSLLSVFPVFGDMFNESVSC